MRLKQLIAPQFSWCHHELILM